MIKTNASMEEKVEPKLTTLKGIRREFNRRWREMGVGRQKLGLLAKEACVADIDLPKPFVPNTFHSLMTDHLPTRLPGAKAWFVALGATQDELKTIMETLELELEKRRVIQEGMGAANQLPEPGEMHQRMVYRFVPVLKRLRETTGVSNSLTMVEYILGPERDLEMPQNIKNWGLYHYLSDLKKRLQRHTHRPRTADAKGAAEVVEAVTTEYRTYLLDNPDFSDMVLGTRPWLLYEPLEIGEVLEPVVMEARSCVQQLTTPIMWFADALLELDEGELLQPELELALEKATERCVGLVHNYCTFVVYGSTGSGALYRAAFQTRSTPSLPGYTEAHEYLVSSYKKATKEALKLSDSTAYTETQEIFSRQFSGARWAFDAIWKSDYEPELVLETGQVLIHTLWRAGQIDRVQMAEFIQRLFALVESRPRFGLGSKT